MTPFRHVTCAATALALLTGGVAGATSSSSCSVITDPAGDATDTSIGVETLSAVTPPAPNDSYLDLLSAGLATDGRLVTTALRLSAIGLDVTSPDSSFFEVSFRVGGQAVTIDASTSPAGSWSFAWFNEATGAYGDAAGAVDADRKEIRMTAPAAALSPLIRRGAKLTAINVRTGRFLPIGLGAFVTADSAATQKPHVVSSHSCLRPVH